VDVWKFQVVMLDQKRGQTRGLKLGGLNRQNRGLLFGLVAQPEASRTLPAHTRRTLASPRQPTSGTDPSCLCNSSHAIFPP
jgi:hypothetical protein